MEYYRVFRQLLHFMIMSNPQGSIFLKLSINCPTFYELELELYNLLSSSRMKTKIIKA